MKAGVGMRQQKYHLRNSVPVISGSFLPRAALSLHAWEVKAALSCETFFQGKLCTFHLTFHINEARSGHVALGNWAFISVGIHLQRPTPTFRPRIS